jgi:hypothetical protein
MSTIRILSVKGNIEMIKSVWGKKNDIFWGFKRFFLLISIDYRMLGLWSQTHKKFAIKTMQKNFLETL